MSKRSLGGTFSLGQITSTDRCRTPRSYTNKSVLFQSLFASFSEEITPSWLGYCIENLADLPVKMARNQLVLSLIPGAAARTSNMSDADTICKVVVQEEELDEQRQEEASNRTVQQNTIRDCLLWVYHESPILISTAWHWYDSRKKLFIVDGHERPNVMFRRNKFCTRYLTNLELRAHRWIQVTAETVEE